MLDLLASLVLMLVAVGGAETVRATCRRQLSMPVPARLDGRTAVPVVPD